jgi:hypothetical protein
MDCAYRYLVSGLPKSLNTFRQNILQGEGFEDDAKLDESIKKLEADLKRSRKKDADGDDQVSVNLYQSKCF